MSSSRPRLRYAVLALRASPDHASCNSAISPRCRTALAEEANGAAQALLKGGQQAQPPSDVRFCCLTRAMGRATIALNRTAPEAGRAQGPKRGHASKAN